ncbi:unnamed protein product, partial [Prorocentrum cordatum]
MDADWSSWDLGSARRALFGNNEPVSRRVLRRLHLRWFHANKKAMKRMLTAGGVPPKVLQLVGDVAGTCRVCRLRMKNGTKATTTVELSIQFNDEVQFNVLFHERRVIGHLCDGCSRFTVERELVDKTIEALLDFIWTGCIQVFGPMAVLTVDGGGAMVSEEAGVALGRMGTAPKLKAPGQCAQAAFAKKAFLTIGEGTPCKARRGRAPLMPRDFDWSGAREIDDEDGLAMFRYYQRLREIAAASIVEATAQARTERAAKARTAPAAEYLQLEVGDLVGFCKQASAPMDVPDWMGPAK